MKYLQYLQMIPLIVSLVKAMDQALPVPGQGAAKLEALLEAISAIYGDISAILPQIKAIVAAIVKLTKAVPVDKTSEV